MKKKKHIEPIIEGNIKTVIIMTGKIKEVIDFNSSDLLDILLYKIKDNIKNLLYNDIVITNKVEFPNNLSNNIVTFKKTEGNEYVNQLISDYDDDE